MDAAQSFSGWSSLDPELWQLIISHALTGGSRPRSYSVFTLMNRLNSLLLVCKTIRNAIVQSEWLWELFIRRCLGFLPSSLPSEFPSWRSMFQVR